MHRGLTGWLWASTQKSHSSQRRCAERGSVECDFAMGSLPLQGTQCLLERVLHPQEVICAFQKMAAFKLINN